MRVSKADGSQVLDLQRDALLAAGVSERHLYSDTASGKKDDRPGLAACLQALREGDTLVVWKLDRLGRSLRHLVNVVHDLTNRGVGLRVLTGQGAAIDTTLGADLTRYEWEGAHYTLRSLFKIIARDSDLEVTPPSAPKPKGLERFMT